MHANVVVQHTPRSSRTRDEQLKQEDLVKEKDRRWEYPGSLYGGNGRFSCRNVLPQHQSNAQTNAATAAQTHRWDIAPPETFHTLVRIMTPLGPTYTYRLHSSSLRLGILAFMGTAYTDDARNMVYNYLSIF